MATKIRLKRLGKIRSPHYRIIVIDSRAKRDGQAIEEIGLYHPKNDPSVIRVNSERAQYWLSVGAQPTEAVVAILKRTGDWQQFTGDKTPSGVDPQPEPRDREAAFAAALAEDGDATAPAISKAKKKAEEAAAAKAAEEATAAEAPAEEAAAEEALADEAPAEEAADAEAPAEEA
ncbi:MAG TPA: 30S ribosomal protein S16 [Tessaracoccus flavescens]|uniref:Small ribosomal subunit protein bS16 n=1 Tax=Tessaracoccus flavescens TaxID=399497 RepID=A0A921ERS4_9ACTN|nr:30S ribosomal protein S16 [Tessaracoccus flavescens]